MRELKLLLRFSKPNWDMGKCCGVVISYLESYDKCSQFQHHGEFNLTIIQDAWCRSIKYYILMIITWLYVPVCWERWDVAYAIVVSVKFLQIHFLSIFFLSRHIFYLFSQSSWHFKSYFLAHWYLIVYLMYFGDETKLLMNEWMNLGLEDI